VNQADSTKVPLSIQNQLPSGDWADEKDVYYKNDQAVKRDEIALVGNHNLENILAAIGAAKLSGATNEAIRKALRTFSGVKHRLQFVDNINSRLFYNDSKATNILATEKALAYFQRPTIRLAGGLDRGKSFT